MRIRDIKSAINSVQRAKKKVEEINKKYPKKYKQELEFIGDYVITDWYSAYDPIYYDRLGRLYDAYKVELNGLNYEVIFDSSLIGGNDLIFENSFMSGYHGGSSKGKNHPAPGIPYWRTPHPFYSEWGRPALRSFSPYTRMVSEMNKLIKKIDKEKQNEFNKEIAKVQRAINRLK